MSDEVLSEGKSPCSYLGMYPISLHIVWSMARVEIISFLQQCQQVRFHTMYFHLHYIAILYCLFISSVCFYIFYYWFWRNRHLQQLIQTFQLQVEWVKYNERATSIFFYSFFQQFEALLYKRLHRFCTNITICYLAGSVLMSHADIYIVNSLVYHAAIFDRYGYTILSFVVLTFICLVSFYRTIKYLSNVMYIIYFMQRVHNNSADNPFKCTECSCSFKKLGALNAHISRLHTTSTGPLQASAAILGMDRILSVYAE